MHCWFIPTSTLACKLMQPCGGFNQSTCRANLVFQCDELATEIFSHLAPGPLSKQDTIQYRWLRNDRQRALSRAARMCRAWSEPALDALWRVVDDVHDLLRVLPCIDNAGGIINLQRDPTPAEWERLQRYAERVCELHWCTPPTETDPGPPTFDECPTTVSISPSVWTAISGWYARQGRSELCPRLQRLVISSVPPELAAAAGSLIHILLTPTIQDLKISAEDTSIADAGTGLLYLIQPVLATLQSFTIGRGEFDVWGTWLTNAQGTFDLLNLENFRALQRLDIGISPIAITQELVSLFELWGLRSLTLEIKGVDDDVSPRAVPRCALRDTLRELHIKGSPALLSRFAEYAVGPELEVLGVHLVTDSEDDAALGEVRNTFGRIMERTSSRIASVSLTLGSRSGAGGPICVPAIHFLRPLLSKAELRKIAISSEYPYIYLDRGHMLEIMRAWPHLTTLRIDWRGVHPNPIRLHAEIHGEDAPFVGDLVSLAESHPKLRYLSLPSLSVRSMHQIREVPMLGHGLEVLYIRSIQGPRDGRLDHSQLFHLALSLDRMFPDLILSGPDFQGVSKREGRWDTVERTLLALQTGRRGTHLHKC
ncbi:hypothetical protein C8Q70DRAFT_1000386 [Cubamyces menziesii]|nr:hypothetical protein C8Q70DRAFT_1000386 [Cubamyces menziesii]